MVENTPTKQVVIQSKLLDDYAEQLRYGFSTKPQYVAGLEAATEALQQHRAYWLQQFEMQGVEALRYPTQVHGEQWFNCSDEALTGNADAIIVDKPLCPAVVFSADCTPVLLYAPDVHKGAVVHCGWKSTTLQLAAKVATHLMNRYGANANHMVAVIGAGLSIEGFEIDTPVLEALEASIPQQTPLETWAKLDTTTRKWKANVPQINALQLQATGLTRIELLPFATDTHPALFWSFRRGDWQRQGSFLQLLS
jgi:polyphenol oxidase